MQTKFSLFDYYLSIEWYKSNTFFDKTNNLYQIFLI